jgi:hypothetical protein
MMLTRKIIVIVVVLSFVVTMSVSCRNDGKTDESVQTVISTQNETTQTQSPLIYKLPEKIRQAFRPEWTWNTARGEYDGITNLTRDPKTGLFPEPEITPEGLAGYATWDPHLGLYIINSIHIDYISGTFNQDPPAYVPGNEIQWPEYDINIQDRFNNAYRIYIEFLKQHYVFNEWSSGPPPCDMGVFNKHNLTPEWFGMGITDLPMLVNKLEAGAPPAYTMSLIMLISHTDVGITPSVGAKYRYISWVTEFNGMKSQIKYRITHQDTASIGYLALPYIYNELKQNQTNDMSLLPEITDGLDGTTKVVTSSWDKAKWITWFGEHEDEIASLQWLIDHKINMPWLK